jgi:hypothetical protein
MSADDFYSKEHTVKKCPYCFAYLPLNAKRCTGCHKRIGEADKLGFAAKPFDWLGYAMAIVAILVLGIFIWWGFLRE